MSETKLISIETRQDRIEETTHRLAEISADLKQIIAVHEQRIVQQEKTVETINIGLERRRDIVDSKFEEVYQTIRKEDRNIVDEISKLRVESNSKFDGISEKIGDIQRTIWTYMGGFSVVTFLIMYGGNILKVLTGK